MRHRRRGGCRFRRARRDRWRERRRVEPDSARAWRSQHGHHDEGTPSRGDRPRPHHGCDTPTEQDCPDQAATPWWGRGLRDGVPHPALDAGGDTTGRPLSARHGTPLDSTSEDRRRVSTKKPLRNPALTPLARSPLTPQQTSRIRVENTTAITRRFVFGGHSTPQKKGTPAAVLRTHRRTLNSTSRVLL